MTVQKWKEKGNLQVNVITVSVTAKLLPFPVYCVFSCCSKWGRNNFLCWVTYVLCSDVLFDRRNSTSFSFGYSGYFLFVPGKCRCWLVNVVVVFITFLRITGNQLWVPNNRIISSILDDSFLTFNSVFQTNLNGGKQYIYKQIVSSFF